jgi:type II secretory pathway component PulK
MNDISLENGSRKKGSILILVLIVLSSMTILSVGLAYRTRIEMKLAQANARRAQTYYLELGGIERIIALLGEEKISPSTIGGICHFTATAKGEELFEQLKDYRLAGEKLLTYSLRDEQGYLNINKSDPAIWKNIDSISRECRSSILDWIDPDDDTSPDGAETDYYERLDPPYISKNSPCIALKELLFLRGVTHDIYVGEDLNRNSLLDENERDRQSQLPPDNGDNIMDLGLVDIFTVYGNGKININTTSRSILAALPGLDEDVADIILAYQSGADGQFGTADDVYFISGKDLANVEGLTELQIELLQQYCCFDSEYFRIFSYARLNTTFECCLMATVRYTESQHRVLYLERLL